MNPLGAGAQCQPVTGNRRSTGWSPSRADVSGRQVSVRKATETHLEEPRLWNLQQGMVSVGPVVGSILGAADQSTGGVSTGCSAILEGPETMTGALSRWDQLILAGCWQTKASLGTMLAPATGAKTKTHTSTPNAT